MDNNKIKRIIQILAAILFILVIIIAFLIYKNYIAKEDLNIKDAHTVNDIKILTDASSNLSNSSNTLNNGVLDTETDNSSNTEADKSKLDLSIDEENGIYSAEQVRKWVTEEEECDEKLVFLTFDDGPSLHATSSILDTLAKNDVKATFYYYTMNETLEDRVDVIRRTIDEGHSIGLHTNTHKYELLYPEDTCDVDFILEDINICYKKIKEVIPEFDTNIMRFPGGSFSWNNKTPARKAVIEAGYQYLDWNTATGDADASFEDRTPEKMVEYMDNFISGLDQKNVIVVLMHDSDWAKGSPEALQSVIDYYKERDYKFAIVK